MALFIIISVAAFVLIWILGTPQKENEHPINVAAKATSQLGLLAVWAVLICALVVFAVLAFKYPHSMMWALALGDLALLGILGKFASSDA